jgi:hypothetical protein
MNEEKFAELVNLYFDSEISSADFEWLQQELASNPTRKREFEARYRLHQAMRMALNPDAIAVSQSDGFGDFKVSQVARLSAWILGSGLAACLSIGFVLLMPMISGSSAAVALSAEANAAEELPELEKSDMERFAAVQRDTVRRRGSLAAQLRLLGLKPEMAPQERQLSGVDLVALRQREELRRREIDQIDQFKAFAPIPAPRLFESLERPVRVEQSQRWPAGFKASLASFK